MPRLVQTLLLDPAYWNARLEQVQEGPGSWLSSPRTDLHGPGRWVEEFRMKAHDGELLWGLVSYPSFFQGARPCCIRAAGPADPIELDPAAIEQGTIEILVQSPAGRRLEDRVLDLLRIYHQAQRLPTIRAQALAISNDPLAPATPMTKKGESGQQRASKGGPSTHQNKVEPSGVERAITTCGRHHTPDEVWIANEILRAQGA